MNTNARGYAAAHTHRQTDHTTALVGAVRVLERHTKPPAGGWKLICLVEVLLPNATSHLRDHVARRAPTRLPTCRKRSVPRSPITNDCSCIYRPCSDSNMIIGGRRRPYAGTSFARSYRAVLSRMLNSPTKGIPSGPLGLAQAAAAQRSAAVAPTVQASPPPWASPMRPMRPCIFINESADSYARTHAQSVSHWTSAEAGLESAPNGYGVVRQLLQQSRAALRHAVLLPRGALQGLESALNRLERSYFPPDGAARNVPRPVTPRTPVATAVSAVASAPGFGGPVSVPCSRAQSLCDSAALCSCCRGGAVPCYRRAMHCRRAAWSAAQSPLAHDRV